jgi:translocation and assembly module TamA
MKKLLIFLCFSTIFVAAQTFTNVKFTGDVDLVTGEFDRATLLKVCHIDYPAFYKIWKSNPIFEKSEIDGFAENLEKYAKSMGYYKVEISSKADEDTIYLSIKKNEAIKTKVIEIPNEFAHFSLVEKDERFRTIDFTETKNKISAYLAEHGYPTFEMNAKAYVDIDLYKVEVKIEVNKGTKRYFSTTELNNSTKIDNALIEEQIVYEEGELYNILKLEESYENIYRLGVFEEIKMKADFNNTGSKSPISIALTEGETKEFASNLGYDTEDGARGGIEYIDHNFFGNLREFRVGVQVSQRGHEARTSYYDPQLENFLLSDFSFLNEISYSNWDYDAYVEKLFVERVTLGKKFVGLEHYFGFQLEHSEIESGVPTFMAGNYLINSLFYRVLIDGRDSVMDAKNGYYTSLYVEKAMSQLGSDMDYLKIMGEARYIKEFKPMVWAAKVKVGTISDETPPFKHFFLGGAMSNRGYEYRDLGLHSGEYPIGGLSMIDASLESRYHLNDNFAVVGFIDASKLSQEVNAFSGEWFMAYGTGLRYLSVIGPLRLDLGFPTTGGFALHLGIGQVF